MRKAFNWTLLREPVRYAILENGRGELHLLSGSKAQAVLAYYVGDRVDGYHDAVRVRGADISCGIEDRPRDKREFEVTDPDGGRQPADLR